MNEKLNNPVEQELGHFIRPSAVSIQVVDNQGQRMDVSFSKVINLKPSVNTRVDNVDGLLKYLKDNGWIPSGFTLTKERQNAENK